MGDIVIFAPTMTAEVVSISDKILGHLLGVGNIGREVRENEQEALDLQRRAQGIVPTIRSIRERHVQLSSTQELQQLEETVYKIKFRLEQYAGKSKFQKGWNRNRYTKEFLRLSRLLSDNMIAVTMAKLMISEEERRIEERRRIEAEDRREATANRLRIEADNGTNGGGGWCKVS